MLQQDDLLQIEKKGITLKTIENQIDNFHNGFPFIRLLRPAFLGDGILSFEEEQKNELIHFFEEESLSLRVIKFVPASGAASRMFKHLFEFRESMMETGRIPDPYFSDTGFNSVNSFFHNLSHFACYNDLCSSLKKHGKEVEKVLSEQDFILLLDHLLGEDGLNYAFLPKALLAFHNYEDGPRSAMEEHLVEAANYVKDLEGISRIHFTISPEHILKFEEKISLIREKYEHRFNTRLDIQYSIQKSYTDTLAVDELNRPFRLSDGSLLFRPAGHGALLTNLNDLEADVIFIKNIDNVVPDRLKTITFDYKKLIGGLLLVIRKKIFNFLKKSESEKVTMNDVREMALYATAMNLIQLPAGFEQEPMEMQLNILVQKLNRPIRICGMVRNIGEPGGGPFWVGDQNGNTSLQIVESSQVNMKDERQNAVFLASTHFNPVDLVCCTIDYHGKPFILQDFVDESTGFISLKSSGGRTLKAQELPGLWNGSMAGWITLFVEVPILTFNPVKTINDLLRDEHH
jgi:hypothetical protein